MAKFERVKSLVAEGWKVADALEEVGLSRAAYREQCRARGERLKVSRTYTPSRVAEVKRRVRAGELLKDVCADMGMDPKNLARWCRQHGVQLFSKKALRDNYARRRKGRHVSFNAGSKMPMIVKRIQKGESNSAIAKALGITPSYVSMVRKQFESGALDAKLAASRQR